VPTIPWDQVREVVDAVADGKRAAIAMTHELEAAYV